MQGVVALVARDVALFAHISLEVCWFAEESCVSREEHQLPFAPFLAFRIGPMHNLLNALQCRALS